MKTNEFLLSELSDEQTVEGFHCKALELKKAKEKAGAAKVFIVNVDEECFLVRRPRADEFDRFVAASKSEGTKFSVEARNLARLCVVYPTKEIFSEMVNEMPGLGLSLANELSKLAGLSNNTEIKKF